MLYTLIMMCPRSEDDAPTDSPTSDDTDGGQQHAAVLELLDEVDHVIQHNQGADTAVNNTTYRY